MVSGGSVAIPKGSEPQARKDLRNKEGVCIYGGVVGVDVFGGHGRNCVGHHHHNLVFGGVDRISGLSARTVARQRNVNTCPPSGSDLFGCAAGDCMDVVVVSKDVDGHHLPHLTSCLCWSLRTELCVFSYMVAGGESVEASVVVVG